MEKIHDVPKELGMTPVWGWQQQGGIGASSQSFLFSLRASVWAVGVGGDRWHRGETEEPWEPKESWQRGLSHLDSCQDKLLRCEVIRFVTPGRLGIWTGRAGIGTSL